MSASIGGSMMLFSGLERYHGIQSARVDLATAKNHLSIDKLFQAQAQRLQAKYEYLFRLKMVDFYSGKPL